MGGQELSADDFRTQMISWDYHLGTIRGLENVTPDEKEDFVAGFLELREVLGEDWLQRAFDNDCGGLVYQLINRAAWVWKHFATLGRRLRLVSDCPGFQMILPRFVNPKEMGSALAQTKYASFYLRAGIPVEFEPPVGNQKADLRVGQDPGHYIELKAMDQSRDDQRALAVFEAVTSKLRSHTFEVEYGGVVHKVLSKPHLEELLGKIDKAVTAVKAGEGFVHLEEAGTFDVYIYRSGQEALVPKEFHRRFSGPDSGGNEVKRIIATAHTAAWKQLPEDAPSILIIQDQALTPSTIRQNPAPLVDAMDETVYEHQNLVALIVTFGWMGGGPNYYQDHGRYQTYQRYTADILGEFGLVIKNRYGKFPFNESFIRPIATGAG
jgi:hypothetical protein